MKQNERNLEVEAKNILRVAGELSGRRRKELLNKLALDDTALYNFVFNAIHAEPKPGRYKKFSLQQKEDDDDSNPPYSYTGG